MVATTSVAVDGFDVAVGGWWRDLGSMVAVIRRGREENPRFLIEKFVIFFFEKEICSFCTIYFSNTPFLLLF